MKIIGITGASGSGKGYVSDILRNSGYAVIDSDSLCHDIYENDRECINEIEETFGDVFSKGKIDRAKLRKIVFADKEKLKLLNTISHRYILRKMDSVCEKYRKEGRKLVFVDAPQLFEADLDKKCDCVISVLAPNDVKLQRIMKRDNISEQDAQTRLSNQHDDRFFISHSDFIINNNGKNDISYQITKILTSILEG